MPMSVTEKLTQLIAKWTHVPSGGESEWLERGDHPLLNDLVLDTLFDYVRRCDLKACRVVCKKWNLHTIPHMRTAFKVTIWGTHCTAGNRDTRRVEHFVKLISSNELGIPFSKFRLGRFRTTNGPGEQFLGLCGEKTTVIDVNEVNGCYTIEDISEVLRCSLNVQDLALSSNLVSRSGSVVKLFANSIPTFPSLKKITFGPDVERKGLKFCPTLIAELLTAAPNICDIVVKDTAHVDGIGEENGIGIGVVLNAIETLGVESWIQSLHLYSTLNVHVEQLLRMGAKENGLELKSLILSKPILEGVDINAIQIQLATCFKDTLEHLSLEQGVNNILMDFPYMRHLKSLTFCSYPDFDPKPVNLSQNFPVLQTLTFTFYRFNHSGNWSQFFSKFETCPTVKSFSFYNYFIKIHTFHDIQRVFPNLNKLSLRVGGDGAKILREICGQMKQLKSLSICGYIEGAEDLSLDSLFTGIPTQALNGITENVNTLHQMTVEERRERILNLRSDNCRMSSLENLTKLRHLYLDLCGGVNCSSVFYLTDLTAYLAVHSMKSLNHIFIKRSEFTKTCCEILTKETGLETWSFRNMDCEHIIPPFTVHQREHNYNSWIQGLNGANEDHMTNFIDGLGPGQLVGRQVLAQTSLGDIQVFLCERRGHLEIEVVRARGLQVKPGCEVIPAPYVKLYLMKEKKCISKFKTRTARKTVDPLYQQQFAFNKKYTGCILQVRVWGDYGRIQERKVFMGVTQIILDDLDLTNIVFGWYKLFGTSSLVNKVK